MNRQTTDDVEVRTRQIGVELLERARSRRGESLWARLFSDKLMDWAMRDRQFKVQLFRFVDVFPTLQTPQQVHEHLRQYLSPDGASAVGVGIKAGGLLKGALAGTVSAQIGNMASRFIAGANLDDALPRLLELWKSGVGFSVDLLGEACVSDAEAQAYRKQYLDLISQLSRRVAAWPADPILDSDHLGAIPRANVSIKISSLSARIKPQDFQGSVERLYEAVAPILESAARHGVFINFDMEQHALKDLTLTLFEYASERIEFEGGLAMQAYLRSGERDAQRIIDWARRTQKQVTVRLIKGAYWDYETIHAQLLGWPSPVWNAKRQTDACFERITAQFVEAIPRTVDEPGIKLALGSHNLRSIARALALVEARDLPPSALELQMLHGMGEQLKAAAIERGLRLREYVPIGQVIPGMAYLVRRLLENTSNESWLRAGIRTGATANELLASPHVEGRTDERVPEITAPARPRAADEPQVRSLASPFTNEPPRDFSDAGQRERFAAAIERAVVPQVAIVSSAKEADLAVSRAAAAFPAWRDTDPEQRALVLLRAAHLMRQRRDELAGIVLKEAGKPWPDADGDVCEAIDFCEAYARWALPLFERRKLGDRLGELNEHWYQPRGVAVVISPWNFPLAICTGMTTAALVTGNTVVVKPAEQTPGTAKAMCEVLWEAGAPRDVLQFLPGAGETVGAALVRDKRVAIIAFTGSKTVGLNILRAASVTEYPQGHVKRVICEMGGKNAIIIDDTADLDEAVLGVRESAFGYAGQKCSACARATVLAGVHDVFLRRLVESTRSLAVGDPMDPVTDLGPLIDAEAGEKVRSYIQVGRSEGKVELVTPDTFSDLERRLGRPVVGPHIFSQIDYTHRLAHEEVFGPVLAVMRAESFHEALRIANGTSYKLTGGVYSRTPEHLELARREFRVGNLYLNRKITGALVGRQPFGGLGLSGFGFQSGGPEYLYQFVEPRTCTENTMRRGFAPGLDS